MKLGIMQPYLFPYIGYFQLIAAVNKFVIYDDVTFIKQGWINRNKIFLNGKPFLFSVPLVDASSNRAIRDTVISSREYQGWKDKFLKTIELSYSKAPQYEPIYMLISDVITSNPGSIGELARRSILKVCQILGLSTWIVPSSAIYENGHLRAQDRVLDICTREKATYYINALGGRELYASDSFASKGIKLLFLRSRLPAYSQFGHEFIPALSILDVMMFNSVDTVRTLLAEYDLER